MMAGEFTLRNLFMLSPILHLMNVEFYTGSTVVTFGTFSPLLP